MAEIVVKESGLSTSIQDLGRFGYLSEGIPISGCMDRLAAERANLLVGNSNDAALIEWTVLPPKLIFSAPTYIACSGNTINVIVNNFEFGCDTSIYISSGAEVSLRPAQNEIYGYISVRGGVQTPKVLGSRSWFSGITDQFMVKKGITLPYHAITNKIQLNSAIKFKLRSVSSFIKVYKGPEFNLLSIEQQKSITALAFSTSQLRDRMGVQLVNDFDPHTHSILSSPLLPGTVQWTPSGKLIVLMRNAQTIGGYPRILQLAVEAISAIAQLPQGALFHFKWVV
ncbi:biotin-dependent carboxyltransferase family protein [Aquimarina agarivorans]|uniref:5-oxoprolinase subunit C family protein n=1 Tax=Aquimarina agarivorans TaxID=980584 RepID=UPI0002DDD137|nr:allophanate hydrolase [Aquimarina agarivorans]